MTPEIQRMDPPYLQIAAHLRRKIVSGEISPGQAVPSTRALMDEWNVSKATATRALGVLAAEGLTEGRAGAGTIVRDQAPVYRRVRDRYSLLKTTGRFHRPNESSLITAAELVSAPEGVRSALDLPEGAQAIRRHRVTSRDGIVVEISTSWFAGNLAEVAPLLLSRERITQGTAAYVTEQTGRKLRHGQEVASVRLATSEEAQELQRPEPLPLYVTEHLACDDQGNPLTYEIGLCPPGYKVTYDYEIN